MEKFENNPGIYGSNASLMPIDVPQPHIIITRYQGSGATFYSNVLSKQFSLVKREIPNEFMENWEKKYWKGK